MLAFALLLSSIAASLKCGVEPTLLSLELGKLSELCLAELTFNSFFVNFGPNDDLASRSVMSTWFWLSIVHLSVSPDIYALITCFVVTLLVPLAVGVVVIEGEVGLLEDQLFVCLLHTYYIYII